MNAGILEGIGSVDASNLDFLYCYTLVNKTNDKNTLNEVYYYGKGTEARDGSFAYLPRFFIVVL